MKRLSSRRPVVVDVLAVGLGLCLSTLAVSRATAQASYIPATRAFESPACSDDDLADNTDMERANPEWKAIVIDSSHPLPNNPPTILEGFVALPPPDENQNSQAPAEVSEEELPWNHYTHDYTFKVVPDPDYQYLLSSWLRFPGASLENVPPAFCAALGGVSSGTTCNIPEEKCPDGSTDTTCHHTDMEVEWENASVMKVNDDDDRKWGSLPEFAWPSVGDRVWVEGRWIFDCGHPGVPQAAAVRDYVKYSTEIHPPRALATFRLNHPVLASEPSRSSSVYPASWLPVTGEPTPGVPPPPPTLVPVTEADVYVSGNGGGANDKCSLIHDCQDSDHTGPVIPVDDRNYVFDIYPPGTDYGRREANGTFVVTPPVSDASLQWRVVDQMGEIPDHACGPDKSYCHPVPPILCLVDASTPPPDQTETACPAPPARPTRLRVILPFAGTGANIAADSILLGWDDVPAPPTTPAVRTFKVTLHKFTVVQNDRCSICGDGDWRVFIDVNGEWRYISPLFDTDKGIFEFNGGDNVCSGDALTENGDDDCFQFDGTPWIVSVADGTPIHVAVGGFDSRGVDGNYCRTYSGSDCSAGIHGYFDLAFENDNRAGTYEFDLTPASGYAAPAPFTIPETNDEAQYRVEFRVEEIPAATPPSSGPLQLGDPHSNRYVSSATPLVLSSSGPDVKGFQYRFHPQAGSLPTYASALPFPVYWTQAGLPAGSQSVSVYLSGPNLADGGYQVQYSAQDVRNVLEPRHTDTVTLDNTPPAATIVQPAATEYAHSATLTLDYSVSDGAGSGVKSVTPRMDGATTLPDGRGLASGQTINLLTELSLGTHTFTVDSVDNVNNAGTSAVTFSVIVTPDSIKADVTQFVAAGDITVDSGRPLLAKLDAAARARAAADCATASRLYQAFIRQVTALSGKKIDPTAAQIMIGDAEYLIAHCP